MSRPGVAVSAAIMSVSCSDCFSDLLCGEDSGILSEEYSPAECSSDLEHYSPDDCSEESIASFIEDERNFVPGVDYLARFRSHPLDASARAFSVAWILKVHSYYGFQPLTAYLSVNYLDRFLYSRRLPVSFSSNQYFYRGQSDFQAIGWMAITTVVRCLLVIGCKNGGTPRSFFLDLQVEGAKYIFEPRTIRRMELLVLGVLDWRLRSVTPFSFISFFACKLDSSGTFTGFLISRATEIILSNIQEASFVEYWPSCIAAAAILSAANEIPNFSMVNAEQAESWCGGLSKEKIIGCYGLMKDILVESCRKKAPKIIPQLRVTIRGRMRSGTSDSSSSSTSSSSFKRRKLNNCLWVDDDKGNSE